MTNTRRLGFLAGLVLMAGSLSALPVSATHTVTPCTGVFITYEDGHSDEGQFCNLGEHEPWLDLPPPGPEWEDHLHVPRIVVECNEESKAGFGAGSDLGGHVPRYWEITVDIPPDEAFRCVSDRPAPTCDELAPRAEVEPTGAVRLGTAPQHPGVGISVFRGSGDDLEFVSALDPENPFTMDAPPDGAAQYTFWAQVQGAERTECVVAITEIPVFGTGLAAGFASMLGILAYGATRRRH